MTIDEQLRRAFDTLTNRLHGHLVREAEALTADLAAAAATERDDAIAAAVADARRATEQALDGKFTAELAAAEAAAAARAREAADADMRHLVAAAEHRADEAIAAAERQMDERIQTAVGTARAEIRASELAAAERLVDTIRAIDRARSLSEILDTLVSCAGREAARVAALLVRGSTVRGWRFIGFGPGFDGTASFELPLDQAGVIGEAVRTGASSSTDTGSRPSVAPFADLPDGRDSLAVPIPMGGQIVAVLYADQGPADPTDRAVPITWSDTLEVMARHAARCLEALTAIKAARVLTERPEMPAPGPASDPSSRNGEEETEESARRYARLLVSEIRLYHEPTVAAGRRERDLMARLGGEIARARVLYDQRVPAALRERTDYFHAELVRTLANGDATLLGRAKTT